MKRSAFAAKTAFISVLTVLAFTPLFSLAADKKVAVLPLALYADPSKDYLRQGIKSMLASRLSGEGLQVLGDQTVAPFLTKEEENGIPSAERAAELGELLKADYVIFGSITGTGKGYSLDLSILDRTTTENKITNVSEAVSEDQLIPKMSDVVYEFRAIIAGVDIRKFARPGETDEDRKGLFFKQTAESPAKFKPVGRISVRMGIMSMDVGDLDGDGKEEVIALGRDVLNVYKRTEQSLELKGTMEAARGEEFLKVSVGDMDANGRAEIYLVSLYGQRAQSSVWEWAGKFINKIERGTGNLCVARSYGGGHDMLLFQDSSLDSLFTGKIFVMGYEQGKLVRKDPLPDLKGAQLYTLALFDFNHNGRPDLIGFGASAMTEESFIQVWDMEGNILAKSSEAVGGTNNAVRHGKANPGDLAPRVLFNSKIVVMDVDKDGKKEILVTSNIALAKRIDFWMYTEGNLVAFRPEGASLVDAFKSAKINYCLTDMQVQGNRLYLAAQEEKVATFSEGEGRIMWFE